MENVILTPQMLQALSAMLKAGGEVGAVQLDNEPSHYFDNMYKIAAGFRWAPNATVINGVTLDSVQPNWNFSWPGVTSFDGTESMFLARMLEQIRPGVYAKKYPALLWSQHMPANYSVNTGAATYTVTGSDYAGEVKVSKMPDTNTNFVNHQVFQASMGFFSMTLGYQYNLQEVREAIFAGQPLQATLALNCRNLMERKLDEIAYIGETTAGIKGLLNLSGPSSYATPATGAGGSKSWDTKSPEDILIDLNGPVDKMIVDTNSIEIPNAFLLPVSRGRVIETKRLGDGSEMVIKTFFLKNQQFIKEFSTTYRSESVSGVTGKRAVVYQNDPECVEVVIPQPFEQMPPNAMHMTVSTICHMRTGGVALHKDKGVIYVDEI